MRSETVRPVKSEPSYVEVRLSRLVPRCVWSEAKRLAKELNDKNASFGRVLLIWTEFDVLYQYGRARIEESVSKPAPDCECSACGYLRSKDGAK